MACHVTSTDKTGPQPFLAHKPSLRQQISSMPPTEPIAKRRLFRRESETNHNEVFQHTARARRRDPVKTTTNIPHISPTPAEQLQILRDPPCGSLRRLLRSNAPPYFLYRAVRNQEKGNQSSCEHLWHIYQPEIQPY